MGKPKRQALDGLSALVMVSNANADDIVTIALGPAPIFRPRVYCMRHLEEKQHRLSHIGDTVKYPPEIICRMIARDIIVDKVRHARWRVYSIERPTDTTWRYCTRCRMEARRGHG